MATLAVLGIWSTVASALTISPVLVELSPARRVSSITFTNPGSAPIRFQTQTLTWTQADGADRYADTDELVVVPPIAEIAAGGSQIFRVTVRARPDGQEHAYRLIFEDVSEAAALAASTTDSAIEIRVNHNLPVFVSAAGKPRVNARLGACPGAAAPEPAPRAASAASTQPRCVRLDNDGSRYLQLRSLSVEAGGWRHDISGSARVLAGAWKQWTFDVPAAVTAPLRLRADTSDGPVVLELASAPR